MPLSWNETKVRALEFSGEWADESSEDAEAKSFWDAFFAVFGVPRRRVATFEHPVKKSDGHGGSIDLLWKGIMLVEHKSRGKDLDSAFQQAKDYFPGIKDRDLPRYIVVSDFARLRLHDLEKDEQYEFAIKDFYKNVRLVGFVAGYATTSYREQDTVNIKAAERMGRLHDKLRAIALTTGSKFILSGCSIACLPTIPAFSSAGSTKTLSSSAPPRTGKTSRNGSGICSRC